MHFQQRQAIVTMMDEKTPAQANNPWLRIPASDYEGHMNSPDVRQGEFLNRFFSEALAAFKPSAVLVCGCSTGNGLEHIDPTITEHVVGFDINPDCTGETKKTLRSGKSFYRAYYTAADRPFNRTTSLYLNKKERG